MEAEASARIFEEILRDQRKKRVKSKYQAGLLGSASLALGLVARLGRKKRVSISPQSRRRLRDAAYASIAAPSASCA